MRFRFGFNRLMEEADLGDGGGSLLSTPPVEAAPPEGTPPAEFTGPEWLKDMDDTYRNDTMLQHVPDVNTLVKNYVNAQKMIGKDKISLLDEHATEDDISAFYDKLGRPSREEYKVEFGEAGYNDEFQKGFLDNAHKSGVMPKQAQEMFNYFQEQVDSASELHTTQTTQDTEQRMEELKTEWGNGYEKNLEVAKSAVNTLTDDKFKAFLDTSGLGNHPEMVKMFTAIGNQLNEDTFSRETVKNLGITKEEATDSLNTVMGNMEHPYWLKDHPNHKKAVEEVLKYHEIIG